MSDAKTRQRIDRSQGTIPQRPAVNIAIGEVTDEAAELLAALLLDQLEAEQRRNPKPRGKATARRRGPHA